MSLTRRITLAFKALRELGLKPLWLYAWYQMGLKSGYFQRRTGANSSAARGKAGVHCQPLLHLPPKDLLANMLGEEGLSRLQAEADEIVDGRVRLFGGEPVPLNLTPPGPLEHWTRYERGEIPWGSQDVKFIWEPGRFGWAFILGRAYHLTGDEDYPAVFWQNFELFLSANPPYLGPHWASAQEVALRMLAFVFASQVFKDSEHTTGERQARLVEAVINHARRIPPTLAYARSQNNNHLLSEAVGLYTAGLALSDLTEARHWRELGWYWLNYALQTQISEDGTYIQHSSNYHRLMLQAALWVNSLAAGQAQMLPENTRSRLALSTRWLFSMLDPASGGVPNLGPNDGAYILPLSGCAFQDYRPVLQAASLAFLGKNGLRSGAWDELSAWLHLKTTKLDPPISASNSKSEAPHVLRSRLPQSWAYLRVATFTSRPGHADQLHLDLWWRGLNVAQDAGTYLYNGSPPWDNSLARTGVHNTLTVDGSNQMSHAGRFLWLGWAQARCTSHELAEDGSWESIAAEHDGYHRIGFTHQRQISALSDGRWVVEDRLLRAEGWPRNAQKLLGEFRNFKNFGSLDHAKRLKSNKDVHTACLQWLLPDWPWEIYETEGSKAEVRVRSPYGLVKLMISGPGSGMEQSGWGINLVRAGQLIYGTGAASPTQGWVSPTYGQKIPALSISAQIEIFHSLTLRSEFIFPDSPG
jgi:hypothetical protein